jgi:hypothetical protein
MNLNFKAMSPEEIKADELIKGFLRQPIGFPYEDSQDGTCYGSGYMTYNSAVKCAILSVKEIIKAIDWHEFEVPNKELNEWQIVLEILKDKLK